LCTGIYGQMNGYQTSIYEKHKIPGGLMSAFRRKGFLVDTCVHWLAGSGAGMHIHRYWNEIGLLEGRKFLPIDRYAEFTGKDGRTVSFYCDPDRLEKHLLELSPADAKVIHEFADGVRLSISFKTPEKLQYEASTLEWTKTILSMVPLLGGIQKWTKMTVGELAARFQSQLIRDALNSVYEPDFSVFYMVLSTLGFLYKGHAGYPVGGSLPLALFLEKRYRTLGGQVKYQARVEKILVEYGKAVGVRFVDGTEQRADIVVSAADGYTTIFKMLEGKFVDNDVRERYEKWKPFRSILYVSAGVNRTFPEISISVEGNAFELQRPVVIAGDRHTWIPVHVHSHDPSFAPPGKTVLTSAIFTNYAFWEGVRDKVSVYEAEKDCIAQAYLEALEQIWPGISQDVVMVNVATPLTFERITGNWRGSITGWKLTPEQALAAIPQTLPGLENFWMVGHWVYPGGGIPGGPSTGREAIWKQCKKHKKAFVTLAA
jgi:phytoene dehydrogenase-like protein